MKARFACFATIFHLASWLLLFAVLEPASANTEIRNFDAVWTTFATTVDVQEDSASDNFDAVVISRTVAVDPAAPEHSRVISQWPIFTANASELSFKVFPAPLETALHAVCEESPVTKNCAHQLWIALDLDDPQWQSFSKFTLRLSWPAFYPADFDIAIYSPAEVRTLSSGDDENAVSQQRSNGQLMRTRRKYARIRLVDIGVRNPKSPLAQTETEQVPFTIILEPLYLSVVPATVIPTVILLVTVIALAALYLPSFNRYLEDIAKQARSELSKKAKIS